MMMNHELKAWLMNWDEPDFFVKASEKQLEEIHGILQEELEAADGSFSMEIDADLMENAEARLAPMGWTLEEAAVLLMMWSVVHPEKLADLISRET